MPEFTPPTGERAEKILAASREVIAAGQTILGGAPELAMLRRESGLPAVTVEERDWAFRMLQIQNHNAALNQGERSVAPWNRQPKEGPMAKNAKDAKSANLAVHCAACDQPIPAEGVGDPTDEGKVYVTCHGARQGVRLDQDRSPLVAFEG